MPSPILVEPPITSAIYKYVLELLKRELEFDFKYIDIMAEWDQNVLMRVDQIPALFVQPGNLDKQAGDWTDSERRTINMNFRLIHASIKHNKTRLDPGSIYDLEEKVLKVLYSDKRLGGLVHGMDLPTIVTELPTLSAGITAVSRNIAVSYYVWTNWNNAANNDPLLESLHFN